MSLTKINIENNCRIKYDNGENIIVENGMIRTARSPHKLKIPQKLDADLAYLVGYHLGDGYLEDVNKTYKRRGRGCYEIDYADENIHQIKLINDIIHNKFGHQLRIYKVPNINLWKGKVGSCKVLHWFFTAVLKIPMGKKNKIKIPKWVLKKNTFLSNFLSGFFDAEGDISETSNHCYKGKRYTILRIQLTQKDKSILIKIKQILYNTYNIRSNIFKKWKQEAWVLRIWGSKNANRFKESINFRNNIKKEKLNTLLEGSK